MPKGRARTPPTLHSGRARCARRIDTGSPVPGRSLSANRPLKVASRCFALVPEGRPSGPSPPPRAVAGPTRGRKTNGYALPISDVYYVKPIYPSGDRGRGSLLAPGVFTLGTKPDRGPTHTRTMTRTRTYVLSSKSSFFATPTALQVGHQQAGLPSPTEATEVRGARGIISASQTPRTGVAPWRLAWHRTPARTLSRTA